MDTILTLTELSAYLKLSEKTLQKMIKNSAIPCTKIANQWRFSRTMIDDWLRSKMEVIPTNDLSRLIENEYDLVPLSRLIDEDSMIMDLRSDSKLGVLTELAHKAMENKLISDKESLIAKLIERENLASTAIGNGIAIPHLRSPSVEIINKPKIVIGRSQQGIDFNSSDGRPTHLFFLILSENEVVHLRILSKLSHILRDQNAVLQLGKFSTTKEFISFFINSDSSFSIKGLHDEK